MEKVQWNSIDKKENGLKYSKNDKSSTLPHFQNHASSSFVIINSIISLKKISMHHTCKSSQKKIRWGQSGLEKIPTSQWLATLLP